MLFTSTMPTHAEKNRGRRVLFPLKRANIAAICLYDRAAGRAVCAPPPISYHAKGTAWQMRWRGRAWGRLRVHAQAAQQPGYGGYLGVEAGGDGGGDGCERKFQHALTVEVEVEARREKQLDAEVLALHVHDRMRLCYRAIKGSKSSVAWVTAWPPPAASGGYGAP
jgi:hypothetical protein